MEIIFQVFEIIFGYLGSYSIKKRNIFTCYVLSTIFSALMFYSVGNYGAIMPILTTGIRYFVFIFKDKYKTDLPLVLCLIMHCSVLVINTKTFFDIIPSALVIFGCLIYWYLDKEKLKAWIFVLNIPWIFYYFFSGLYIVTINAILQTILIAIAYLVLKYRKKILLSFNYKFFKVKPKELIDLVKKYDKNNLIYGFEVTYTSKRKEYIKELTKIAHKNGYIINIHSVPFEGIDSIKEFLEDIKEISKITKRKINVVFHPIDNEDKNLSIEETRNMLKNIYNIIDQDEFYTKNIIFSIENLNYSEKLGHDRLKKEDLIIFLKEFDKLKFTYDIGHELIDGIYTKELPDILKDRLSNIHIHTYIDRDDHNPVLSFEKEEMLSNLLINYGQNNYIVMEYAYEFIQGKNFKEKIKSYVSYAKIVNSLKFKKKK